MYVHGMRSLFRFPGSVVDKIETDGCMAQVDLRPDGRRTYHCPNCDGPMSVSRRREQSALDVPLGLATQVTINYQAVQCRCRQCGIYHTFRPEGIDEGARATTRLMDFVSMLCRFMPLSKVRDFISAVDPSKAFRWDNKVLERTLPEPQLDGLGVLLVDEKAVRRGHGYVTLVMNGVTGEFLYLAEGKKKESLQGFFDLLSETQKASIKAVAMDRGGAYYEAVKANLPEAKIVFDRFHIMQNLHAAIDLVRREEWRAAEKADKSVIKGQRYNLFRRPENNTQEQSRSLQRLLDMNKNIAAAYLLASALRELWTYLRRSAAEDYFDHWIAWARESGVSALVRFAKSLERSREEVLNYFQYRITTGPLEGFNNTVSRLIHRACGVRNLRYLFLKLRQESLA